MKDVIEQTSLTNLYELHQNVTARYGRNVRFAQEGKRLTIRLEGECSNNIDGVERPVLLPETGDIVSFTAHTFPSDAYIKRRCLTNDDDRVLWFYQKGVHHGFTFNLTPMVNTITVNNPWSGKPMLKTVFKGIMQVTDAEKFHAMLKNGIGASKMLGSLVIVHSIH